MGLRDSKPILRFDDQIDKLTRLGIYVGESEDEIKSARKILSDHNYYYKLLAYRKNYDKDENGLYNISFDSIVDLAKLDMQLRYALLPYCLDVEHSLKTFLMRLITNRKKDGEFIEDGYSIVESVFKDVNTPSDLKDQLFSGVRFKNHDGTVTFQEGFEKYYNEPPIWVVLDLASIGKLKHFVNYMLNVQPNNRNIQMISNNISYVTDIRNSCAHNKPILLNLQKESRIKKAVYVNAKRKGLKDREIMNLRVAKIFALFELHRVLCSDGMRVHRNQSFGEYLDRVNKTLQLHDKNIHVQDFFKSLEKILDLYKSE